MSETGGGKIWRRASRCESAACVEVALEGERVHVRESGGPGGHELTFSSEEWLVFIQAAKTGEFDPS
jgi:hypothetical protein